MITATEQQKWLASLVTHLRQRREAILKNWQQRVDNDDTLQTASQLSRTEFRNGIPCWLDALEEQLAALAPAQLNEDERTSAPVQEEAREHGSHRWEQGYNLCELTREWGLLQLCLSDEIESFRRAHAPLHQTDAADFMHGVRQILMRAVHDGIVESARQYHDLQQREAAAKAHDLQDALDYITTLEKSRGETLREVSHDLRGGLTVVQGAAQLLDITKDEPTREMMLEMVQRGVVSLHRMLSDLMDLARLEAGQESRNIQSFDAAIALRELGEMARPLAEKKQLALHLEGPVQLPIEGDEIKVRRIAQNLLLNAIKYTNQGEVRLSWKPRDENQWMFSVQDTGPGLERSGPDAGAGTTPSASPLPTGQNERRAHPRQGEGIGLSIVRRLCELLDARLEMRSAPGVGTSFDVIFPRSYPAR